MQFQNNKGFTLVELFVSMAIVGILAAMGFTQFGLFKEKAHHTKLVSYYRELQGTYIIVVEKVLDNKAYVMNLSAGGPYLLIGGSSTPMMMKNTAANTVFTNFPAVYSNLFNSMVPHLSTAASQYGNDGLRWQMMSLSQPQRSDGMIPFGYICSRDVLEQPRTFTGYPYDGYTAAHPGWTSQSVTTCPTS